ncbi:substrate-binding domain-containing protein [Actinomadura fulvescens]|uniref:Substrate-binding domain-containing protein n=1 Tax=Actinomadura fulvescens TaxID=46160 RepID=A0ABP6D3R1_9ACTN
MHAEERHEFILRELRDNGSIRVAEVAGRLKVSPITIRRDVETLADRGLLVRVHGGARLPAALEAPAVAPSGASASASANARPVRADGQTLGMLVPSAGYYYPEVIRGARETAAARGARLVLGISRYHDADEDEVQARRLVSTGVDGLLLTPSGRDPDAQQAGLADLGVPVVLVERPARAGTGLEHVISAHSQGAETAAGHLARLGYRQIGLVTRVDSPTTPWLREGFQAGLAAADLKPGPFLEAPAPDQAPQEYEEHAVRLAEEVRAGRLEALLVHNDHDAIQLTQRLRALGLQIPSDVAIVAYDDEVAALADIPLTAVAPPKYAVGAAAMEFLLARLADPGRPRHRLALLPELRVRASCGQRDAR